jgi:FkbM family methyltransferase
MLYVVIKELLKKTVSTGPFSYFASTGLGRLFILCFSPGIQNVLMSGIRPQIIKLRIAGIKFQLYTSTEDDHFESAFLKHLNGWEDEVLAAWANLIKKDEIAIDVGAYLGIYSILGASMGANLVLAYEPNPFTASRLQQNIDLNHFSDGVLLRNVALANSSTESFLIAPKGRKLSSGAMLSSLKIQSNENNLKNWEQIAKVKQVKLDDDIRQLVGRLKISVIKIDAEGSEMDVLKGAQKTLVKYRPNLIIELLDYESLSKATAYLMNMNYASPKALDGASHTKISISNSKRIIARNYLFQPR